ncbi:hypothetical protein G6F59_015563 [Rhizopus arrhizus]|nr:hypothetical protein G6F59_015563 [Rhizopus arrhizus]
MRAGRCLPQHRRTGAAQRQEDGGAELGRPAAPRRPDRTGTPAPRPDPVAVRRNPGPGRHPRRRRRRDSFRHDDHPQACARLAGRALPDRQQYRHRGHHRTAPDLPRFATRGRRRLSGQPERGGQRVAGGHRAGPHHLGNLGGPVAGTQYPSR